MNAACVGLIWLSARRWFKFAVVEQTGIATPLSVQGPVPIYTPGFSAFCAHNLSEWLPRYATDTPQSVPSCCSSVTFHDWMRGELIPGSIVPNVPNGT